MTEGITYASMKDLKPGRFVLIDNAPCRVVDVETSAPGKHGAAKMRVTAIGLFDNQKRTLLKPSDADVEVPIITKKKAQVVSVTDSTAQLMDMETYETYELSIPEELKGSIRQGAEIEVIESMGRRAIARSLG
ncbi:MAG: translation initiation factor IF-5A [Candidatus Micrarchaeaceae archaeon]